MLGNELERRITNISVDTVLSPEWPDCELGVMRRVLAGGHVVNTEWDLEDQYLCGIMCVIPQRASFL